MTRCFYADNAAAMEMLEMLSLVVNTNIFFGIEKWQIFGKRALPNSTLYQFYFVEPQARPASLLGSLNHQLDVPIDH
ncbi:hypothetical protein T10_155 [Trichinella papuae]|uniref:Uncharacterized protein n=1 Tax=Trichinella papuae TaxID=268474 RepID=A0A0V1M9Z5_9BILA|nr:hypothetical protein T10_155 [Trichinella papuae]